MSDRYPILMGAETEYALSIIDPGDWHCRAEDSGAWLLLKLAADRFPHLEAADGRGIYLANGGKLYVDCGAHPEYATPECTGPDDVVRYTVAGDRMMARLVQDMEKSAHVKAMVSRGNVGYGFQPATWGCHESYLCRGEAESYVDQLAPFLASRLILAGSGGFDPMSPGIAFTLSPRSHFICSVQNRDTTSDRPLINLRDESLSTLADKRLHLICADSLGSESGIWIRSGITALVVAALDLGHHPVKGLKLSDTLGAMRTFAADPSLTAEVSTRQGVRLTAIDIQRRYLQACAAMLKGKDGRKFPEWAPHVVRVWEQMLNMLERNPSALDTVLDWRIKQTIYSDFCTRQGFPWRSLPTWNAAIHKIRSLGISFGKTGRRVEKLVREESKANEEATNLQALLDANGLHLRDLPRLLKLRSQLFELDTRFLQIGGIFEGLDSSHVLSHRLLHGEELNELAVTRPPSGSRATLRGAFVGSHPKDSRYSVSWTAIHDAQARTQASLGNPFETTLQWSEVDDDLDCMPHDFGALSARGNALTSYLRGDYGRARAQLQVLVAAELDLASTYCHLARIGLTEGAFEDAERYTRMAADIEFEAEAYIRPRIHWLELVLSMLGREGRPVPHIMHDLRATLVPSACSTWSIEPALASLRPRLSRPQYALLSALADAINRRDAIRALGAFEEWMAAA